MAPSPSCCCPRLIPTNWRFLWFTLDASTADPENCLLDDVRVLITGPWDLHVIDYVMAEKKDQWLTQELTVTLRKHEFLGYERQRQRSLNTKNFMRPSETWDERYYFWSVMAMKMIGNTSQHRPKKAGTGRLTACLFFSRRIFLFGYAVIIPRQHESCFLTSQEGFNR